MTHYTHRVPESGVWVPLPFVTRKAGDPERYYFGFDEMRELSGSEIRERESQGLLHRLEWSERMTERQRLWLAPDGDVWLAADPDPLGDSGRRLVERGRLRRDAEVAYLGGGELGSPVIRSVTETRQLSYLFGDYLNSRAAARTDYEAYWQMRVLDKMLEDVRSATGDGTIVADRLTRQEHRYHHIATLIKRHAVALCFEIILWDEERKTRGIDVVPLGNVTHYTLLWVADCAVENRLSLRNVANGAVWPHDRDWLAFVRSTGTTVCSHADTVADHVVEDAVTHGDLPGAAKIERRRISELLEWLRQNREDGLVVCDVGVVWQIVTTNDDLSLRHVLVPYRRPVTAGLAYDADDSQWGNLLRRAVHHVSMSQDLRTHQSLENTRRRFSDIGAVWTQPLRESSAVRE